MSNSSSKAESANTKENINLSQRSVQSNNQTSTPTDKSQHDVTELSPADTPLRKLTISILKCFSLAFSGFIFGYDVGTIGGISNFTSFTEKFAPTRNPSGQAEFNKFLIGFIIAIFHIGCAIGGLTLAKTADWRGRRFGLFLSVLIYLTGAVIQSTSECSSSWVQFMIGRLISGLGVGSSSVIAPMYIAEIAPLKIRGSMVVLYQLMITLGIFLGNVVNFACHKAYFGQREEWLIPICLEIPFGLLVGVGIFSSPESPVYKVNKDDITGARYSFAIMNRLPPDSGFAVEAIGGLVTNKENIENESGQARWNEFLTGQPKLLRRTLIGCLIMFFQQWSGANYFFIYGTTIFKSVGLENPYVTSMILGAVNFAATPFGAYLVEKLGRRKCLISGSALMFVCVVIYSSLGVGCLDDVSKSRGAGSVMIVFTCIYIIGFATTWGPVAFVVVSELYPVRVRAMSMAMATACNWISNFLITFFSPFIIHQIDFKYGYVFAGCLLASGAFVYLFLPETKGLKIEEIDAKFQGHTGRATYDEESSSKNPNKGPKSVKPR